MAAEVEVKKADHPLTRVRDWFEPPELFRWLDAWRGFDDRMRVEEEVVNDQLVIRAEAPGVDPDKDVEITIDNDALSVAVERRKEETTKTKGGLRSEFRYGSFHRTVALPKGTGAKDVKATYRDGILEIHVPMPKGETTAAKVAISRD